MRATMFELDEEQQAVVDSVTESTTGSLIAGDMGTGKTLIGTEIIKTRPEAKMILIICPKSTFGSIDWDGDNHNGWLGTLFRQDVPYPVHLVKSRDDLPKDDSKKGIWIIGREAVAAYAKETKTQPAYRWGKIKWDIVIYDEIHYISNRKSQAFKTIKKLDADLKIGLSGTPFRSRFSGLWSVTKWIWPKRINNSFWEWAYKWCRVEIQTIYVAGKSRNIRLTNEEKLPGMYVAKLPNYHRLTRPRLATFRQLEVDLTPAQRKVYKEMQDRMLAEVEGGYLVADLPITQRLRLREIALAVPSVNEDDTIFFEPKAKSSKLDALEEYLDAHPAEESPLIVFTHSKRFAKIAAQRIEGAELWTGDTPDAERELIKKRFFSGESHIVIATVDSFGTGTDGFQNRASTIVFLSRTESPTDNEQAIGRLDRRGQNKESVLVIDIVAKDTHDTGQLMTHARKSRLTQESMRTK